MKKLLLLAAAALSCISMIGGTAVTGPVTLSNATPVFKESATSLTRPDALRIPGIQASPFIYNRPESAARLNAPSRADDRMLTMPFALAGEPYGLNVIEGLGQSGSAEAIDIKAGVRVYLAFAILKADVQRLAGSKITEVTLVTSASNDVPVNPIPEVEFFITDNFGAKLHYTQKMNLGNEQFVKSTQKLTTPYEISDEYPALVFGYSFVVPAGDNNYWLPTDGMQTTNQFAGLISATNDKEMPAAAPATWYPFAQAYGSLCLYLKLEGENLPQNDIAPLTYEGVSYTKPGENSPLVVLFENTGANNIDKITIAASVDKGEKKELESVMGNYTTQKIESVRPGEIGLASFEVPIPADAEGVVGIDFTVTGVNEIKKDIIQGSYSLLSYSTGYDRKVVFEDATGTWCGWCPAGIVMMEYVREKYPDALPIGVHGSQGATARDPMALSAYVNALNVSGFPTVYVNRSDVFSPGGASEDDLKAAVDDYMEDFASYPSYASIELSSSKKSATKLGVTPRVNFSINLEQPHSVALVVIEDNVGPYNQSNYYSGNASMKLGDWSTGEKYISTIYNDVARGYSATKFTDTAAKGKEYVFDASVAYNKANLENPVRVAAMVINDTTGEIVNAAVLEALEGDSAGVDDIVADTGSADITVGEGSITVEGAHSVAIYSLDGLKVADGSADSIAPGIYIVVADGHSTKVAVR